MVQTPSTLMCGFKAVVVRCDELGNVDLSDLETKLDRYSTDLAAVMVTYPSTHGVFEEKLKKFAQWCMITAAKFLSTELISMPWWGFAILDTSAAMFHLNLHKTFCIPHGGGGPVLPYRCWRPLKAFPPGTMA